MRLIERVRRALRGADTIEATDRYGGQWPDADTVCPGPCEGMGVFPAYSPKYDQRSGAPRALASPTDTDDTEMIEELGATPGDDGWVFLTCPECDGSGKRVVVR